MKVIAQNQIKLSKKVDLMNKRLKNFLNEAVNTAPIDLNSLSVKEESVEDFSEFAKYWEDKFFKDMEALNIMYPNYITRVSDIYLKLFLLLKL